MAEGHGGWEVQVEPAPGTAADYMRFLEWAERTGELPKSTVVNWRVASTKVLQIEDNWQEVNVANFDLDAHLGRFATLKRTAYSASSLNAYKSRTKVGIEAYRMWLAHETDWKPRAGGRPAKAGPGKIIRPSSTISGSQAVAVDSKVSISETSGYVPHHTALIEYPFPLRPGLRALLALPEDLTEKEARRVARFVESLAFSELSMSDQVSVTDQLSITRGEAPAE
jgi:hypothetical protein